MSTDPPPQTSQASHFARTSRVRRGHLWEACIHALLYASGSLTILVVVSIFVFLFLEAVPVFKEHSWSEMLTGREWRPTSKPQQFGLLPLLSGSMMVTLAATVIAVPLGIGGAIYIAELASSRAQAVLKPLVELLAAVPSVVLGFLGLTLVSPVVRQVFHLPTGLTGFTASVMLAYMSLPTILSLADDAMRAVPQSIRQASFALGTTRWQTIRYAVLPAARSGIIPAVMLGIGRAIGETMTVLMVAGMAGVVPHTLFQPMRTMTATIAAEMGEAARGTPHFHALFLVGGILFVITFVINLVADVVLHRGPAQR